MPRIDDLSGFFAKTGGGEGSDPSAPSVFWDGYGLDRPYSGIFSHARALATELRGLGVSPVLLGTRGCLPGFADLDHVILGDAPLGKRWGELKPVWPHRVARVLGEAMGSAPGARRPVVVHGLSNFNIPFGSRRAGLKQVLTVHDVVPLLDPKGVSRAYRWQFKMVLARALRGADAVVCISRWTRDTLLAFHPEAEARCRVIPNGVGPTLVPVLERRGSGQPHRILCISRFEPYKRLDLLVRILRLLPKDSSVTLVTDARGRTLCEQEGADLMAAQRLIVMTALPEEKLKDLFAKADVYLQPSRFEGFCLPAADALLAGVPIVYQAGSGLDELVEGQVGVRVESSAAAEQWAEAVVEAAHLAAGADWGERVATRLCGLSTWRQSAAELKTLYNELS